MAIFKQSDFVLSLAGLELISFITAVWCCVFQTKPVLIINQSFTYCGAVFAQHRGFVSFLCCPHRADKKLGGKRAWRADPGWAKGYIPCHTVSCSAFKTRRGELVWHAAIAQSVAGHPSACQRCWVTAFELLFLFSLIPFPLLNCCLDPWILLSLLF